jgi:patatin-like phospholipase/acyl hydrolase
MWTSFSTMAGGGVRGKIDGIAHNIIAQVGPTIKAFHPFIERCRQVGGITTGSVVGKGINGSTSESPTNKFNGTGTTGKRADIGRSKITGVSRA